MDSVKQLCFRSPMTLRFFNLMKWPQVTGTLTDFDNQCLFQVFCYISALFCSFLLYEPLLFSQAHCFWSMFDHLTVQSRAVPPLCTLVHIHNVNYDLNTNDFFWVLTQHIQFPLRHFSKDLLPHICPKSNLWPSHTLCFLSQ